MYDVIDKCLLYLCIIDYIYISNQYISFLTNLGMYVKKVGHGNFISFFCFLTFLLFVIRASPFPSMQIHH